MKPQTSQSRGELANHLINWPAIKLVSWLIKMYCWLKANFAIMEDKQTEQGKSFMFIKFCLKKCNAVHRYSWLSNIQCSNIFQTIPQHCKNTVKSDIIASHLRSSSGEWYFRNGKKLENFTTFFCSQFIFQSSFFFIFQLCKIRVRNFVK